MSASSLHATSSHLLHHLNTAHHLLARHTRPQPPSFSISSPLSPVFTSAYALPPPAPATAYADTNGNPNPNPNGNGNLNTGAMGNNNNNDKKPDVHTEETILFLFLTFGILIVLILILLLLGFQTYLSYRIAHVLVEDEDGEDGEGGGWEKKKDFRRWDRERRERRKALRALEKGRSIRGSWGYGSGSGSRKSGGARPRTDEEMGMTGARGSSMMLDKFKLGEVKEKKPFWNLKRWI